MWLFSSKKRDNNNVITSMQEGIKESFDLVKGDFKKVSGWINTFNKRTIEHDERIYILEGKVNKLMNLIIDGDQVIERVQSFNRSSQSFMNDQSNKDSGFSERLTPIQKKVVAFMIGLDIPLEYSQIAKKLGLNIVTVRRHINDIKRTGFEIKEKVNTKNKRKVFYIDEKIKKMILRGRSKR